MQRIRKASWLLAGMAVLAACTPQHHNEKVVRFNDPATISVTDTRSVKKNNITVVQATFLNTGMSPSTVLYRFKWVDSNGLTLGEEAWKPQVVNPGQSVEVRGVAPSPAAADFVLELSQP